MSATRYRRFLKLCEEWPRDEYKKGRDLGTFLRQKVATAFREGENTQVTLQQFKALKKHTAPILLLITTLRAKLANVQWITVRRTAGVKEC